MKRILKRASMKANRVSKVVGAVVVGSVVTGSNAFAAGTLGTVSSIDTTDFAAVAIVVLTFAGIAYGVKKALGLIGK
jgi:TRAP-type C4-dicarboxylate transport system permease small subunit